MYSKLNVGKNILVGVHFSLLWLRKLAKALEKSLKRKKGIISILFSENNGK